MDDKRNRILELVSFIQSLGIEVNIGKNKARGNKGFFRAKEGSFRIDIAKNQKEEEILHLLVHEFAHYLHYTNDKTLKSLDFIFNENDDLQEEMIELTVNLIPKSSIEPLFRAKDELTEEIKSGTNVELQRKALRRVNAKIARLNRYYNMPTELFARTLETYFTANDKCKVIAPIVTQQIESTLANNKFPVLNTLNNILNNG